MNKIRIILVLLCATTAIQAQDVNPSVWTFYNGRYDLNNRWFLNSEVHFRFTEGVSTFQQFLFRPQMSYVLNPHFTFSLGYTYIHSFPYGEYPIPDDLGEHNAWEEVMIHHAGGPLKISHRIRMEHRWIQQLVPVDFSSTDFEVDGFTFSNRFRYRLILEYHWKDSPWSAMVYDEMFFSTNEYLLPQGLNQNWLYLSAKYQINEKWSVQSGWQQQYLKLGNESTQQNPTWLTAVHFHLPAKP